MMTNYLFKFLLLFAGLLLSTSKPFAATEKELITKDTVEVGLWVEDIYNIDYVDRTFEVVFWIWANSDVSVFFITCLYLLPIITLLICLAYSPIQNKLFLSTQ